MPSNALSPTPDGLGFQNSCGARAAAAAGEAPDVSCPRRGTPTAVAVTEPSNVRRLTPRGAEPSAMLGPCGGGRKRWETVNSARMYVCGAYIRWTGPLRPSRLATGLFIPCLGNGLGGRPPAGGGA